SRAAALALRLGKPLRRLSRRSVLMRSTRRRTQYKGRVSPRGRGRRRQRTKNDAPTGNCRARGLQALGRNSKIARVPELLTPFPRYSPMRTRVPLPPRRFFVAALLATALVGGWAGAARAQTQMVPYFMKNNVHYDK